MKKIISLLMLVMSITGTAIAQQEPGVTNADKIFNIPAGYLKRSKSRPSLTERQRVESAAHQEWTLQ